MAPVSDHDKLASRLGMILTKLNDGEKINKRQLAEEFGVSEKTIERDLHQRLAFLPIEKQNGYYSLPAYALGKLSFHDIKAFAEFSGIKDLYPELTHDLIVDILNAKTNQTMHIRGLSYESLKDRLELFNRLGGAMLARRIVSFIYHDKPRRIKPYKLFNNQGVWYLVGVDEGMLKHFALSKIEALRVEEATFQGDESIEATLEDAPSAWFTQSPIEVTVHVDRDVAGYFLRRDILPSQRLIEEDENGLVLACSVAFEEQIERIVRYWIPHLRILSPARIQTNIEASLRDYLQDSLHET